MIRGRDFYSIIKWRRIKNGIKGVDILDNWIEKNN